MKHPVTVSAASPFLFDSSAPTARLPRIGLSDAGFSGAGLVGHRRRQKKWQQWLAGAVLIFGPGAALASEPYAAQLDRTAGVAGGCPRRSQRCLICHNTTEGGEGTADQAFAVTLAERAGFEDGEDARGLAMALTTLQGMDDDDGDGVSDFDTDGDGVSDFEELAACDNPSGDAFGDPVLFGCDGAHLARSPRSADRGLGWLSGGLVVAALLRGARRARSGSAA